MTLNVPSARALLKPLQRHAARRWAFAALGAVALHLGGVALVITNLQPIDSDDASGAPGLEIELDLAAPQPRLTDLPPGSDPAPSVPSPTPPQQKAVMEQSNLPKDTPDENANPDRLVSADPAQHSQDDQPDALRAQAKPSTASVAAKAVAIPSPEAAPQSKRSITRVQGTGESRQRVRTSWQKELLAHLDRHKRYPLDRTEQSAEILVRFVLDRAGHVLSSSIAKSSGDASFDAAALSMLKRSDPVPPPPPLIAADDLSFTLPVIFRVKGRS